MRNTTKIIIIALVVILVVAGTVGYVVLNKAPSTSKTLVVAAESGPDTLDPAITSTTPGWGVVQQIYQTLVAYDNSSVTSFVGVIAQNWTVGPNYMNWTFYLRQNVTFSNGDPVNAYVMWYSLNRAMLLNGSEAFILEQNLNTTVSPNFLNTTNFSNPTASELAVMESNVNSVYVVSKYVLHIAVGGGYLGLGPYAFFLQTLTSPIAAAVDPIWVNAHGGVVPNTPNSYMSDNALGSGPYVLTQWVKGDHLTLSKSPSYWANNLTASQLNNAIAPAKENVVLQFSGSTPSSAISAVKSGSAQMMGYSFSPTIVQQLSGVSNIVVNNTPIIYGSTQGSWYLFFNLTAPYFNITDVRAAVVHAINYTNIINNAFGGYASQWVGPVPPGFPDYNPGNLQPYQFNLTLAKQEMTSAGYPNGLPGSFQFLYINSPDFQSAVQIIQSDLHQIGINITLYGVDQNQWSSITSYPGGNASGYSLGIDFYTADYISPDDYTWEIAAVGGSPSQLTTYGGQGYDPNTGLANITTANFGNMSDPLNQINNLVYNATVETNAAARSADYAAMTSLAYNNYLFDWLVVPYVFTIYRVGLHGIVLNPMGSAYPNFVMSYNTEYYT